MGNSVVATQDVAEKPSLAEESTQKKSQGRFPVEIAASVLFGIPPLANAYHTSIVVAGEEYFFSDQGMCFDDKLVSHQGSPTEKYEAGRTDYSGTELWWALQEHFRPGTYDLLRKNCNSFSDAALFFLCRKRLDKKYSSLETLGRESPELVRKIIYIPNPVADDFRIETVIASVEKLGEGKKASQALAEVRFSIPTQDHRIPHLPRPSIKRKVADKPKTLSDITNIAPRSSENEAVASTNARAEAEEEKLARAPPRKYASSATNRPASSPARQPLAGASTTQPSAQVLTDTRQEDKQLSTPLANDRSLQLAPRSKDPERFLTNRVYPTNRKAPGEDKENLTPRSQNMARTQSIHTDSSKDTVSTKDTMSSKGDESRRSRSKSSRFFGTGLSLKGMRRGDAAPAFGGA